MCFNLFGIIKLIIKHVNIDNLTIIYLKKQQNNIIDFYSNYSMNSIASIMKMYINNLNQKCLELYDKLNGLNDNITKKLTIKACIKLNKYSNS